jgi:hypothetical protein
LAAFEHRNDKFIDFKGGCLKGVFGAAGPDFMLRIGFYYAQNPNTTTQENLIKNSTVLDFKNKTNTNKDEPLP